MSLFPPFSLELGLRDSRPVFGGTDGFTGLLKCALIVLDAQRPVLGSVEEGRPLSWIVVREGTPCGRSSHRPVAIDLIEDGLHGLVNRPPIHMSRAHWPTAIAVEELEVRRTAGCDMRPVLGSIRRIKVGISPLSCKARRTEPTVL